MTTQARTLNVGIAGLGTAGGGIAPAVASMENVRLVGAADVNRGALEVFRNRYGGKTYESIEAICADPEIDTLWIATPNVYHLPHTVMAANAGKHVVVEKPMAITLDEAQQMIDACKRNGVHLVCGGSKSASVTVRKMREIIRNGDLGALKTMTTWAATDWMLRPRRPDEYDLQYGGGVVFRQSPHQVESMRVLAGGMVRSVRGITGQWMPTRDTAPGCYTALLEFESGVYGTLVYGSHGYFMAAELFDGSGAPDAAGTASRVEARRAIVTGARNDVETKEARNSQGAGRGGASAGGWGRSRYMQDLGLLVVSCERGDMRQSPNGIYIYGDDGTVEVPFDETRTTYSPELEELSNAIVEGKPLLHGGRWGLATLEVSLAIMQSAQEHRDILLEHQVPTPDWA